MAAREAVGSPGVLRLLTPLLRWRYVILGLVAAAAALHSISTPFHDDWRFFLSGSRLLFGDHPPGATKPGGLHIYASYNQEQIGPLALLLVTLLRIFGNEGSRIAAMVIMTACGPVMIWLLESAARDRDGATDARSLQFTALFGGTVVLVAWGELAAFYLHLDDAMALLFAVVSMVCVSRGRGRLTGVFIGLAVAATPWAIVLLPLVLVFAGRERWRATVTASGIIALTWLPFFVDPGTLSAGRPYVLVDERSVLHLIGLPVADPPDWVRVTQLLVALLLGVLAVRRGRWPAVLCAGIAVRVLLDPAVWRYYSTGLILAAFAWEILRSRRPLPGVTMVLFWLLFLAAESDVNDTVRAVASLIGCSVAILLPFVLPASDPADHEVLDAIADG